nr:leucine-rich repeat-containing protein 27 [Meriones unguiculatus]
MEDTSTSAMAEEATNDPKNAASDAKDADSAAARNDNERGFEGVIFSSSSVLDLSQKGLCHLGEFLKVPHLQQLHLQRNSLIRIPKDFFQLLPNLIWLDLRYNKIRALPSGIGSHKHLKTLLLERNPIKMLPVELGQVATLKALNLRFCPLEFPPHLIVQKGLVAILTYLRFCSVENAFPGDELPQVEMGLSDLSYPVLSHLHIGIFTEKGLNALDLEAAVAKEKAALFPRMGRLDLSKSSAFSENWPSKEEIKRFWKLRQEIVGIEEGEVQGKKHLAAELPPNLREALNNKEKRHQKRGPTVRKKSTPSKGILPNIPSTNQNTVYTKRLEDGHMAAVRELQEKEALLEQRRRDKRVLKEWREQTQLMRSKRELNNPQPFNKNMMASKIPFATDRIDYRKTPVDPLGKVKHSKERTTQRSSELSTLPLAELEERIKRHTEQIHARNFLGTNPLQDIKVANQDLENAKKLQEELGTLKLKMTLNKEHPFGTLTGNLSLHPPASQPQKIFFNTKY